MTSEPESAKQAEPRVTPPASDASPQEAVPVEDARHREVRIVEYSSQGPIPDPHTLALYQKIDPRLVDFCLDRAKQEQVHRHTQDVKMIDASIAAESRGQYIALAIIIAVLLTAGIISVWGNPALGGAITLAIIGVQAGTAFVRKRDRDKQERRSAEHDGTESDPR